MTNKDLNIESIKIKKIDGTISSDEEILLNKYFKDHPDEEAVLEKDKFIWQKSPEIKIKQKYSIDQRWMKLESRMNQKRSTPKYRNLIIQTISVAASLLIFLFFYFKYEENITITANNGEIITSTLPDKSVVILNSGSSITYKQGLFSNKRRVTVKGEVFFNVEKKRKVFIVNSDYARIEVLGTEFNIKNRNAEVKVSCSEGHVKVMNNEFSEQAVILEQGFATSFQEKSAPQEPYQIDQLEINGWTKGIVIFNQTPIIEVFSELQRTYNITISTTNINSDITYNGEFDNKKVDEILEIIALSLDLELIKIDDTQYKIE